MDGLSPEEMQRRNAEFRAELDGFMQRWLDAADSNAQADIVREAIQFSQGQVMQALNTPLWDMLLDTEHEAITKRLAIYDGFGRYAGRALRQLYGRARPRTAAVMMEERLIRNTAFRTINDQSAGDDILARMMALAWREEYDKVRRVRN